MSPNLKRCLGGTPWWQAFRVRPPSSRRRQVPSWPSRWRCAGCCIPTTCNAKEPDGKTQKHPRTGRRRIRDLWVSVYFLRCSALDHSATEPLSGKPFTLKKIGKQRSRCLDFTKEYPQFYMRPVKLHFYSSNQRGI